jgi:hypothetical protein
MDTPDFMPPEVFVRLRFLGLTTEAMYYLHNGYDVLDWARLLDMWERRQDAGQRPPIDYYNGQARKHGHTD